MEEASGVIINISERDRKSLTEGPYGYLYNIGSTYEVAVLDYLRALYHNGVDRLRPQTDPAEQPCITSLPSEQGRKPLMLADLIGLYCDDRVAEGGWTPRTESENRAIYKVLRSVLGPIPISDIQRPHLTKFSSTIQRLPANMNKSPRYRGLTVEQILSMDGVEPIAARTVKKYLARVSAMFEWAELNNYLPSNPAKKLSVVVKKSAEERKPYNNEDIRRLLSGDVYGDGNRSERYQFWLPLLALFTGARLEELSQLHTADVYEVNHIWVVSINDEGNKQLKTRSSKRLTPVHPTLIELGFLRFVERMRALDEPRLFPELRKTNGRAYGHRASKWYGDYRRRCGVTEKGKVFHSFRNTVVDNLKQQGFPREQVASIVGHAKSDITYDVYAEEYSVEIKYRLIEALHYNVDMSHLLRSSVNPYLLS